MHWTYALSILGLAIGAGMGLYAMIRPSWASWLVRLKADPERPGGFAEFRGTYGGLFFFGHAVTLALLINALWPTLGVEGSGMHLGGALVVCAALWWGTMVGRLISILADRQGLPFNGASVGFEAALGALIAAPLIATAFGVWVG